MLAAKTLMYFNTIELYTMMWISDRSSSETEQH